MSKQDNPENTSKIAAEIRKNMILKSLAPMTKPKDFGETLE